MKSNNIAHDIFWLSKITLAKGSCFILYNNKWQQVFIWFAKYILVIATCVLLFNLLVQSTLNLAVWILYRIIAYDKVGEVA